MPKLSNHTPLIMEAWGRDKKIHVAGDTPTQNNVTLQDFFFMLPFQVYTIVVANEDLE